MDMALTETRPDSVRLADEAFHRVLEDSAPAMRGLAIHMLGAPEDAADALQEAWLRAWRSRAAVRDPAALRGWLRAIVARECLRAMRWRSLRRWLPFGAATPELAAPETPDLVDAARIRALVARLPPQQRACFALRFGEGLTTTEIGEALNMRPDTVKTHLSRALTTVRRRLEARHG